MAVNTTIQPMNVPVSLNWTDFRRLPEIDCLTRETPPAPVFRRRLPPKARGGGWWWCIFQHSLRSKTALMIIQFWRSVTRKLGCSYIVWRFQIEEAAARVTGLIAFRDFLLSADYSVAPRFDRRQQISRRISGRGRVSNRLHHQSRYYVNEGKRGIRKRKEAGG